MAKYTPSLLRSSDTERKAPIDARKLDESQYKTEHYQYPADLLGNKNQYGKNYAVFYINVAADSKLAKEGSDEDFVDINQSSREISTTVAQSRRLNTTGTQVQGVIGAQSFITGTPIGSGFLGGTAGVLTGEALKNQAATFQGATRRLKTAIALHMPNLGMQTRYGVNYEEKDMQISGVALEVAGKSSAIAKAALKFEMKDITDISNTAGLGLGLNLPGGDLAQKLTGIAPNPRREQIFRNVDFRTFQMQYEFYPRDEKEAENVKRIIKEFKYHMHPEFKDSAQFLYVYPSEFDIVYYHGTEENENVNKHTSCVLTEVNVNYAPQGQFTSFSDGTPTQINLVLTFRELVPLSKETIDKGL